MQKYNLREQLINSTMDSLKIDKNPFNYATILEFINHISDDKLKEFYKSLFGSEHKYTSGMDRVKNVADKFKPTVVEDNETKKAKKLLNLVRSMNSEVYREHLRSGINFSRLLDCATFPSVSNEDIALLNTVKPFCELKSLISGISTYETEKSALKAFKSAIKDIDKKSSLKIERKV